VAIKVVASAGGGDRAKNRSSHATQPPRRRPWGRAGHLPLLLAGDEIPDDEVDAVRIRGLPLEEDAAVACVEHAPAAGLVVRQAGGGRGHEAGGAGLDVEEEPQYRGRAVELAEPAPEAQARDEAAPALADERGADEARGLVRREAEQDVHDELLRQGPRRRGHD